MDTGARLYFCPLQHFFLLHVSDCTECLDLDDGNMIQFMSLICIGLFEVEFSIENQRQYRNFDTGGCPRSKEWLCGRSLAGIASSIPACCMVFFLL
jgi:hypothetical protein